MIVPQGLALGHLPLAVVLLEAGSGLQGVLVPCRGHEAGFATTTLGLLGGAYYAGFVVGCFAIPTRIGRVGHIRTFAGLAAAGALVHGLLVDAPLWLSLRAGIGFCSAGIMMAVESWLDERADGATRGRILAAYVILSWIGVTTAKLAVAAPDPAGGARGRPSAPQSTGFGVSTVLGGRMG